jgi:hypothetical protein
VRDVVPCESLRGHKSAFSNRADDYDNTYHLPTYPISRPRATIRTRTAFSPIQKRSLAYLQPGGQSHYPLMMSRMRHCHDIHPGIITTGLYALMVFGSKHASQHVYNRSPTWTVFDNNLVPVLRRSRHPRSCCHSHRNQDSSLTRFKAHH